VRLQLEHRHFSMPRLVAALVGFAGGGVALALFLGEPTNKGSSTADDFGWEPKKQAYFVSTLVLATAGVILGISAASGEQLVVDKDEGAAAERATAHAGR
jgi:hypothetical protein